MRAKNASNGFLAAVRSKNTSGDSKISSETEPLVNTGNPLLAIAKLAREKREAEGEISVNKPKPTSNLTISFAEVQQARKQAEQEQKEGVSVINETKPLLAGSKAGSQASSSYSNVKKDAQPGPSPFRRMSQFQKPTPALSSFLSKVARNKEDQQEKKNNQFLNVMVNHCECQVFNDVKKKYTWCNPELATVQNKVDELKSRHNNDNFDISEHQVTNDNMVDRKVEYNILKYLIFQAYRVDKQPDISSILKKDALDAILICIGKILDNTDEKASTEDIKQLYLYSQVEKSSNVLDYVHCNNF